MASGVEEPTYDFVDQGIIAKFARLNVRPRGLAAGNFTGMHRSSHHGASVEFAEYRKYVPGDDTRRIDWRVYAKSDRFYLKEVEADTNLRCYLVLDCSGSMTFASDGMSLIGRFVSKVSLTWPISAGACKINFGVSICSLRAIKKSCCLWIRPKSPSGSSQRVRTYLSATSPSIRCRPAERINGSKPSSAAFG